MMNLKNAYLYDGINKLIERDRKNAVINDVKYIEHKREIRAKLHQKAEAENLLDALRQGFSVEFYNDYESKIEITSWGSELDPEDLKDMELHFYSPYDCTGKLFTTDIRQFYSSFLNRWIVVHHMSLDV